jgi:hypothetical protein
MKYKFRKIDAVIIAALIIIAGIVLFRAGYAPNPVTPVTPDIDFIQDDENEKLIISHVSSKVLWKNIQIDGECDRSGLGEYVLEGDEIVGCLGTIILKYEPTEEELGSWTFTPKFVLPSSIFTAPERTVTPEDEGVHYTKLLVSREWWYYTVVFGKNSELSGWTLSVSFNHMSRFDLFMLKPDMLVVTLLSPNGDKYGGIIERERPLGILKEPTLRATSSEMGFKVSFDNSYATGKYPNWHLHVEGSNIDQNHDIKIDLQFFAPGSPLWLHSNRLLDKSQGNIASYVFIGCEVNGVVNIDGFDYHVNGIGHHEHTWASGLISKGLIRGWDWCHITLDNGWNVYYSNYYLTSQIKSTKTYNINPFGITLITTNHGVTLTRLSDVNIKIEKSDNIFPLLNIPSETNIESQAGILEILMKGYEMNLKLNLKADNTIGRTWKRLTHVGMKIGRCTANGVITCKDDDGLHEIELNGVGTIWNMRH